MAAGDAGNANVTVDMLEERLRLLDYIINGSTSGHAATTTHDKSIPAVTRLRNLERNLNNLTSKSSAAADVLALQKEHPHVFSGTSSADEAPPISADALAALILAHTKSINSVSSNLNAIKDTPLPDSTAFTRLLDLEAKIVQVAAKQQTQAKEFAYLRTRSAILVEKWYQDGVLDLGDKWADWEERLRDVEILVRRKEAARRREQEGVV